MIISVASGKGGTGKTTVATNMAFSIDSKVKLLDCDVEEPNSHLFIRPEIDRVETVYTSIPQVDENGCSLCKKCMEICRFNAITVIGETILTFPELCHSCGGCMEVCPEKVISEGTREIGVLEKGKKDNIEFFHGRIRIGETMSPPLIRKVRSFEDKDEITIIDAPPGTSCPVISAMKGADYILMVTEPTPFGMHDLKLAVDAVKILGIPRGLVINRSDIGDESVKEYAEQEGLDILMEIPFDRKIAEAYSKGNLLAEEMPEWKDRFLTLSKRIEEAIA